MKSGRQLAAHAIAATSKEVETVSSLPTVSEVGDAFGDLMAQCCKANGAAGHVVMVFERDDGLVTFADGAHYFQGLEGDDGILDRVVLRAARGRILDVGCGVGRHSLYLKNLGLDVMGLESSAGAVDVCKNRGVDVVHGDIFQATADLGRFDTFLLMGNNLGLLATPDTGRKLMEILARMASPGAIVLAEGIDPYATSDPRHLAYHQRNFEQGRARGQVRMRVRYASVATGWFEWWQMSVDELGCLVSETGWQIRQVWRRPAGGGYLVEMTQT